jgi:hypothetical protein
MSYYMADTPGRLRIESPALKTGAPGAGRFRDFIINIPGILSVDMKPEIGSALIHYDPKAIDHTRLIEILDGSGYFDHSQAATPDDRLEKGIEKVVETAVTVVEDAL